MIQEQRDKVKELRKQRKNTSESDTKIAIGKEMGIIINQGIQELKSQVDKDNLYKKYIKENEEMIAQKYAFNVSVENHDEAVELLKTLDIREILNIDVKANVPFESKIFFIIEEFDGELCDTKEEANMAIKAMELDDKKILSFDIKQNKFEKWQYNVMYTSGGRKVYINKINGQYRLFFKRNIGVDRGIEEECFDIINIFEIIGIEEDTYKTIKYLCALFNIGIRYCIEQEEKYDFNMDRIYDTKNIKINYPILFEFIEKHIDVLLLILEDGKNKINTERNSYNGENVFFCSGRHLERKFKKKFEERLVIKNKKQNQISKLINTFCCLGLLTKLKKDEVPKNMYKVQKGMRVANYFIVKKYTEDVFIKAQEIVCKLNHVKNGISATQMSTEKCKELLGEDIWKAVY